MITMRNVLFLLIFGCALDAVASNFYKLEHVKRVDSNLYSASSGATKVIIETKYCYEYANGFDDAVLKYDRYSYDNKLIFDSNVACDVEKVMVQ